MSNIFAQLFGQQSCITSWVVCSRYYHLFKFYFQQHENLLRAEVVIQAGRKEGRQAGRKAGWQGQAGRQAGRKEGRKEGKTGVRKEGRDGSDGGREGGMEGGRKEGRKEGREAERECGQEREKGMASCNRQSFGSSHIAVVGKPKTF